MPRKKKINIAMPAWEIGRAGSGFEWFRRPIEGTRHRQDARIHR